jgi:hypothetical protein
MRRRLPACAVSSRSYDAQMQAPRQPVWSRLEDAKEKLTYADAQLLELDSLTSVLVGPTSTSRQKQQVSRVYLGWLVFSRQVGVSINEAGRAAGSPVEFGSWWNELATDPTHVFFRDARNGGLKRAAEIIVMQSVIDEQFSPLAYWTFAEGPHRGEPLIANCQLYADWLYYSMWVPASERLFEWTLPERLNSSGARVAF